MSERNFRRDSLETSGRSPYSDLFIYYLDGQVSPDHSVWGPNFLGCWQEEDSAFLFFSAPSGGHVEKTLQRQPQLTLIDEFRMTYDEWQGGRLTAFRVGRFFITPPWHVPVEEENLGQGALPIVLDPGLVFGTGTHPTTRNCLEAIQLVFRYEKPGAVIDLGTGTGLLALAASRLGCKKNLAIDLNFLAAKTALKNVRLNRMQNTVLVVQGRAEDFIDSPSDLVIANIHYDVMKRLIQSEGFFAKKWFVLSGLLRTQAREISHRLCKHPVEIIKKWEKDGVWHTFLGRTGRANISSVSKGSK